jgi:prepilin peptidase CpaA
MDTTLVTPVLLLLLLGVAAWQDLRSFRIPNWLTFGGAVLGLALSLLLPSGQGLAASLAGWTLGLAILLPFYALRAMGAGDVKLLAMAGAFTGPAGVFALGLYSMVAGGVLALVVALGGGRLRETMRNLQGIAAAGVPVAGPEGEGGVAVPAAGGRLPYGVAILGGGIAWWLLRAGA